MRALTGVVVLAVLVAGWSGWTWWSAANDEALAVARQRDAVLRDVSAALVTLHTIDHRTAESDVRAWERVTTGRLGEELAGNRRVQLERTARARVVSSASVVRAAVTEIDVRAGSAGLLAVLDVRMSVEGEQADERRSRVSVRARRTEGGWKISQVQGTTPGARP